LLNGTALAQHKDATLMHHDTQSNITPAYYAARTGDASSSLQDEKLGLATKRWGQKPSMKNRV
jgi:hypothetical protein